MTSTHTHSLKSLSDAQDRNVCKGGTARRVCSTCGTTTYTTMGYTPGVGTTLTVAETRATR